MQLFVDELSFDSTLNESQLSQKNHMANVL